MKKRKRGREQTREMWAEGEAKSAAQRDIKIIAYLRGQTKTNDRQSDRQSSMLTVYLTYDVNVSAAVIV